MSKSKLLSEIAEASFINASGKKDAGIDGPRGVSLG